jgi:hypothetical protein
MRDIGLASGASRVWQNRTRVDDNQERPQGV